ncbi:hypothetical protein Bca4012_021680 [Brassica carinata]|uniref:Uncharacterized protein n=1 Tax=Brassica carinata TaxID=52824 RepID=A0A8X7PZD1_BRACI|nr:hypothetical protein Bca52824_077633 [Brassica carinata]
MRRGRGKGKRLNACTREDGEDEEKIPAYRRRGRPQKPVKEETEGEEEIVENDHDDDTNGSVTSKEEVTENGKKRKKPLESKESNLTEEKNGLGLKSSIDDSVKLSGFRQIGSSRRKNKPRRAAEAVVECNGV